MYHDVDDTKYPYDLKDNTYNITENSEMEVPPLNDFIKVNGSKPTSGTITIDNKGKITNAVMVIQKYNVTCDSSTSCSVEGKLENEKETKITNIVLNEDAEIEKGDSHEFTATIEPSDADINTLTWCSSSDTVISGATEQGRCETEEYEITTCYGSKTCEVEGINEGSAKITTRLTSNGKTDSSTLTVEGINFVTYLQSIQSSNTDTMYYDGTSDNNLRYYGANDDVHNYVTFNGEKAGWRIIGVFDGKVKLVRATSIGNYSWNNTSSNNWNRPAALRETLNSGAYWNRTSGNCPYSTSTTPCDFSSNGLNTKSKQMISESTWYLGTTLDANWKNLKSSEYYTVERGNQQGYSGGGTTATANIGLLYLSDYGFASKNCYSNTKVVNYSNDTCKNSNWLYTGYHYWIITPVNHSPAPKYVMSVYSNGQGFWAGNCTETNFGVLPTLYLKANVTKVGGVGTIDEPYTIKCDSCID